MVNRITEAQRARVLEMTKAGAGRNVIAQAVQIGAGSVTKIVTDAGLSFDRAATEVAVKARKVDLAAKRAELEGDLLEDAARLRRLLWEPTTYREVSTRREGESAWPQVVEVDQPTPTPQDQLKLMQAATTAITASQRIADARTDQNTEGAKSMLTALMESLGAEWRRVQSEGA